MTPGAGVAGGLVDDPREGWPTGRESRWGTASRRQKVGRSREGWSWVTRWRA